MPVKTAADAASDLHVFQNAYDRFKSNNDKPFNTIQATNQGKHDNQLAWMQTIMKEKSGIFQDVEKPFLARKIEGDR